MWILFPTRLLAKEGNACFAPNSLNLLNNELDIYIKQVKEIKPSHGGKSNAFVPLAEQV